MVMRKPYVPMASGSQSVATYKVSWEFAGQVGALAKVYTVSST